MIKLKRFLRVCAWVFAGYLMFSGLLLFILDALSIAGIVTMEVHGDGPMGGIIYGPVTLFFAALLMAWLWSTRSVLK